MYHCIVLQFVENDTEDVIKTKCAEKLKQVLCDLGPVFIKFGQIVSTRADAVGNIFSESLAKLQNQVEPFSFREVDKIIKHEFGKDVEHMYATFDTEPIAAASVAQVHRATIFNGEKVAVKILRPNIGKMVAMDIRLLRLLIKMMSLCSSTFRKLQLEEGIDTLQQVMAIELNLMLEAASADQLRENLVDDCHIYIPKIYWALTSKQVMTQELVEGTDILDRERLRALGYNCEYLAKNLAVSFFNQVYRDGFFHADIHPGNILISGTGQLTFVDFGIMGMLSQSDRVLVAKILYCFITRDYKTLADIHLENDLISKQSSPELFALACRSIGEPIMTLPAHKLSIGTLLRQLFEVTRNFGVEVQPRFLLLQKTLITIEGTAAILSPNVNMWELAEPWIKEWARTHLGISGRLKGYEKAAMQILCDTKQSLQLLPSFLEKLDRQISSNKQYSIINNLVVKLFLCLGLLLLAYYLL